MKIRNFTELRYKISVNIRRRFITRNWMQGDYISYCEKYKSYWHYKLYNNKKNTSTDDFYFTARPNPGAGIGHQMANWIAGYWWAKYFGLKFAYIPFSDTHHPFKENAWDQFLGFGNNEKSVQELKDLGYKIVYLPAFSEKEEQISLVKDIINSYSGQKIVFLAEQDQGLINQYLVAEDLQNKFYNALPRSKDEIKYEDDVLNIAVHIRRGDIASKTNVKSAELSNRWSNNNYYVQVLDDLFKETIPKDTTTKIYLFSQGNKEDFPEFQKYTNLVYCLDWTARESFLHMVFADILVTSKSSFSYKPALLNKNLKASPIDFWHGYPDEKNWLLFDDVGKRINK